MINELVIERPCSYCGKVFPASYFQRVALRRKENARIFCSRECVRKGQMHNPLYFYTGKLPEKERPVLCFACGKEFEPSESQRRALKELPKARVFCCRECLLKKGRKQR